MRHDGHPKRAGDRRGVDDVIPMAVGEDEGVDGDVERLHPLHDDVAGIGWRVDHERVAGIGVNHEVDVRLDWSAAVAFNQQCHG